MGYLLGPTLRAPYGANNNEMCTASVDVDAFEQLYSRAGLGWEGFDSWLEEKWRSVKSVWSAY